MKTNGVTTHVNRQELLENIGVFQYPRENYHFDNFAELGKWTMVETVKECVKSFDALINKRKLTIE